MTAVKDWILTIAVCLVLAASVFAIVFSLIRGTRRGRAPSCGGNCSCCGVCKSCGACGFAPNRKAVKTASENAPD